MKQEKAELKFSKSERLLKNPDFVRVQRAGRRLHSKHFIIGVNATTNSKSGINEPTTKAKLGITITKKIESSAVKRNRVKRLIREAFRQFKQKCKPGIEIVIIAKQGSFDLSLAEVSRQLYGTLKFNGFLQ